MRRNIGQNQVGRRAGQKYPGRYFVDRSIADLFECREKFSHAAEVVAS
jgi:hypothetical protein